MTPKENRIKKPHDHLCGHGKAIDKTAFVNSKRKKNALTELAGDEDLANWLRMVVELWLSSQPTTRRAGQDRKGGRGNNLHVDGRPYT